MDEAWRSTYNRLLEDEHGGDFEEDFYIHRDGSMRYRGRLGERICLPESLLERAIKLAHDHLGHFGYLKTYERITHTYYRPNMSAYVKKYVAGCPQCIVNKTARRLPPGELQPIVERCSRAFETVSFDMIVSLPWSNNYDAIMVVVDKLTKYEMFIPTVSHFTAKSAADCFFDNVVSRG